MSDLSQTEAPAKWRPSLGLVIACVTAILVTLPPLALVIARGTSQEFARETEASLHAQAAIFAATYEDLFRRDTPEPDFGTEMRVLALPPRDGSVELSTSSPIWTPITPQIALGRDDLLDPRPDATPAATPVREAYLRIAPVLEATARRAQRSTLAGYLALDESGTVIAATGDNTGNFGHVAEVARALTGRVATAARWRSRDFERHSLRSISRDTQYRVFVAHPVIVDGRVIGAVYLSRTPSNLNKYLAQQAGPLAWMIASVLILASVIAFVLWRLIQRPLAALSSQAHAIRLGQQARPEALKHYGLRETATLGDSVLAMGHTLAERAEGLATYAKHATHELKSPVTSILGAAELLERDMPEDRRILLAQTIQTDARKMELLLNRLRAAAAAEYQDGGTVVSLDALTQKLRLSHPELAIKAHQDTSRPLPLPDTAALICLEQMLQNALAHGATEVNLGYVEDIRTLSIQDNGTGIAPADLPRVTDAFFTTRRDSGGTGMGLTIVAETLRRHGGILHTIPSETGASFELRFAESP